MLKKKTKIFLGLIKRFRNTEFVQPHHKPKYINVYSLNFNSFLKTYVSLLSTIHIFESLNIKLFGLNISSNFLHKIIYFYTRLASASEFSKRQKNVSGSFHTHTVNNLVVFIKPKKQLFLILFKDQPMFVFTGGLMRIVMNENKKSSKKMYKVAASLIKLSTILLLKKSYFASCYLKLVNVGFLRSKILNTFAKTKAYRSVNYVIFKITRDISAQKFKTRRSIKKFIKKRFKLNT